MAGENKTDMKMEEKMELRAEQMDSALENLENDLLAGWRIIGLGKLVYYDCERCNCIECTDCEICEPRFTLIIRTVYKPGERLVLYAKGRKVAEGDEEVKTFLTIRNVPIPKVISDE